MAAARASGRRSTAVASDSSSGDAGLCGSKTVVHGVLGCEDYANIANMGYDLHITRATLWIDSDAAPITLEEWLEYLDSDPEMRLDGFAEAHLPDGTTLRAESPGLAVWTAWSAHERDGNMAWFDHRRGRIVVKNPDDEIVGKMFAIAERLGARVQGDEGEIYDEHGRPHELEQPERTGGTPWWRRLFGGQS